MKIFTLCEYDDSHTIVKKHTVVIVISFDGKTAWCENKSTNGNLPFPLPLDFIKIFCEKLNNQN